MRTVKVELAERSYPIFIGSNLLADKDLISRHLPQHRLTRHTHPTLMHLFAPLLCSAVRVCLGRAEACV